MARAEVIGVGNIGYHHARNYAKIPNARLLAIADTDEKPERAVVERFGCHSARSTLEALLKKARRLGYRRTQVAILGKERTPYALLVRSALPPVLSLARGFDLSPKPPFSQQIMLFFVVYYFKLTLLFGYLRCRLEHLGR